MSLRCREQIIRLASHFEGLPDHWRTTDIVSGHLLKVFRKIVPDVAIEPAVLLQALLQARNEIDAFRLRTKSGAIDVLNLHR